jgi:hypothetical protein
LIAISASTNIEKWKTIGVSKCSTILVKII